MSKEAEGRRAARKAAKRPRSEAKPSEAWAPAKEGRRAEAGPCEDEAVAPHPIARYPEVVVATANKQKLIEIRAILRDAPVSLRALDAFAQARMPEEGDDYTANAVAKALAVARVTGRTVIADDSGLEVARLGGRPGPRSARYGGPDLDDAGRIARLLSELAGSEGDARAARFVCVAALVTAAGDVETARGECDGHILATPRGSGGFGYDPVFQARGEQVSMAELPSARKNQISHRGRAFQALCPALERAARK